MYYVKVDDGYLYMTGGFPCHSYSPKSCRVKEVSALWRLLPGARKSMRLEVANVHR